MDLDTTRFALLKAIGGPGSLGFLLVGSAIGGLLLLFRRTKPAGRRILILLIVMYMGLSLPVVGGALAGAEATVQASTPSSINSLDDIFVLDGDNFKARAAVAAQLAARTKPRTVWILGGSDLRDALVVNGVGKEIWRYALSSGRNTYDQVSWVHQSMRETRSRRAAIIVSRLQRGRVIELARRDKLEIDVIGAPIDSEPMASGIRAWLPSLAGLALSRDALYERVAFVYYRWNGWL